MKNKAYKTTKEITNEHNISRQTINSWIKAGQLERPNKDFRNWYTWNAENEKNLLKLMNEKTKKNNQTKTIESGELQISNRRYLGSKQKMLNFISEVVEQNTKEVSVVADLFSGTGVVANLFNETGKKVIVNDILYSNNITYKTWFGSEEVNIKKIKKIIQELNALEVKEENYVSKHFGNKYFSEENAKKIGGIREKIENYDLNEREKAFLLTSLLYAMDKVANTVGHYDAYRKTMDSFQIINLKVPEYKINKDNEIYNEDANQLVKKIKADLVYIDTPYNSRQYGDAYHLLENIISWKKPEVIGVAKKMVNREHIKSKYSTQKATEAFDELIQNIDSKYILVSYNNMAKKGNGRSNAKISNDEIITILKKRGEVKVFETPFKVFSSGKTNIEDHKELLYLCTIKKKKNKYIASAINYTGGKYKLLDQILPLFPKKIGVFYDVFAGGANVAINVNAKKKIINDINSHVIDLYKYIQVTEYDYMIERIEKIIKEYNLSNTKKYTYEYYGVDSSKGLKEVNFEQYKKLRSDYNLGTHRYIKDKNLIFYILIVFAFNNQIRFNKTGYYNMPVGKRDFNKKMQEKLESFKYALSDERIILLDSDFRKILENIEDNDTFVYLDPPYLITNASYNESGGWTEVDELDLFNKLDELDRRGVKFALSNVLVHKGIENKLLNKWSKKYNVNFLDFHYNNSNYQSLAKKNKTVEVLITNYK